MDLVKEMKNYLHILKDSPYLLGYINRTNATLVHS